MQLVAKQAKHALNEQKTLKGQLDSEVWRPFCFQRIVHSFVAGRPILRKGYNMVAFLEDFLKYYNKGPNFARDALATGLVDLATGNNVAPTQV